MNRFMFITEMNQQLIISERKLETERNRPPWRILSHIKGEKYTSFSSVFQKIGVNKRTNKNLSNSFYKVNTTLVTKLEEDSRRKGNHGPISLRNKDEKALKYHVIMWMYW